MKLQFVCNNDISLKIYYHFNYPSVFNQGTLNQCTLIDTSLSLLHDPKTDSLMEPPFLPAFTSKINN